MTEQNIAYCAVGMITIISILLCIVCNLVWKVKSYKKLYNKRGKTIKSLISQVESNMDIQRMLGAERAQLISIINKHPDAKKEYLESKRPQPKSSSLAKASAIISGRRRNK